MPAPIALFAYRRPRHLERTLEALKANSEARDTILYVFSDAPKDDFVKQGVEQVRRLLGTIDGFASVQLVFREKNFGLANNITSGVSDVLDRHGTVIVVEDDILVGQFFLRYMNDALALYRDEPRVGSISAYCYPMRDKLPETFFIRGADCWGWATWRDRWQVYNKDGEALLAQLSARGLLREFDFDGTMDFTRMLQDQIAGRNDSWAVRWHASCFLRDLLILYPSRSLVHNIGNDGTGTHSGDVVNSYFAEISMEPVTVGGVAIEESQKGREAFCTFFRRGQRPAVRRMADAMVRRLRTMGSLLVSR
jgi:hypothetical protein